MQTRAIESETSGREITVWKVHAASIGLLLVVVIGLFLPVLELMIPGTDYVPHLLDVNYLRTYAVERSEQGV